MLNRLLIRAKNSDLNKHKRSSSRYFDRSRSNTGRTGSWYLDESNSSSGSSIYRKKVDESLIALLPESNETFIENNTIIGKLAKFVVRLAD